MSNTADRSHDAPQGAALLPEDLTDNQLAAAPVLTSTESLLIDELTDNEDDAFAAALSA